MSYFLIQLYNTHKNPFFKGENYDTFEILYSSVIDNIQQEFPTKVITLDNVNEVNT